MTSTLPRTPRLRPVLVLADLLVLNLAVWSAHVVRFQGTSRARALRELLAHPGLLVVGAAAAILLATAAELYESTVLRRRVETLTRVVAVAVAWAGAMALATYLVPSWRFGRGLLALSALGWALGAAAVRGVTSRWLAWRPRAVALVIGEAGAAASVTARLREHPLSLWVAEDGSSLQAAQVAAAVARQGASLVVLAGRDENPALIEQGLAALHFAGVPVVAAAEVWAWLDGRLPIAEMSPAAFLHQPGFGAIHSKLFNRVTRVLDLTLGALMLVVLSPLLLVAALLVLLFDGRPVFYRQERVGHFGRVFTMVKLRTMRRDAEEQGPAFADEDDPRVTPLGRLLRRLRLDELPQLINVLRGDMSLVGPRPERPAFVDELARQIPYYTFRLALPPGLTGWAQVNTPYARTLEDHRRKLEYDLYFIRERSITLYLLTLARTASASLRGVLR